MRLYFVVLLLSTLNLSAQSDTIPFRLTSYNNVVIPAILNQFDAVDLMFHTAINSVSLTTEARKRLRKQMNLNTTKVNSWGGASEAGYFGGNTLSIGNFSWDSLTVWISENSGQFSDGKFGPNLFEGKVIELDFDLSVLVVHDQLPKKVEQFSKFDLEFDVGSMYISGDCDNGKDIYENKFMIHSGYGGTILLDDEFASRSEMNKLKIIDVSELKDSYGNVLKKKKAIMPSFSLETFDFKDLPMGFFEGNIGNQKTSVVGGELLKRFNIIFDLEHSVIYLKPNGLMGLPFKDV
jgi:hypothetical protein